MIKIKIHSIVDVITNSSTVIYTYQNSVSEAKSLVAEILKMVGDKKNTPDDIFYYGVFCEEVTYFDKFEEAEDIDELEYKDDGYKKVIIVGEWGSEEYKAAEKVRDEWFENLKIEIMTGKVERPDWMEDAEKDDDYGWDPSSYLCLVPKNKEFEGIGDAIAKLLGSVDADGGQDG